jgi:hypothetical protein
MIAVWAIVLCVILPVGLVANTGQASSDAYVLQWVVLIHTGLALAYILGSGQPRPLHLGFWSFSYGWLGLAPIVQLSHDTYPLTVIFSQTIAFRASAITEVGLLAYTVTWVLSSRESLRPSRYRYLDGRAIVWRRVVVIAVIATVATIYTVPHLGGLHAVFTSRQATNEVPSAGVSKAKQSVSAWGASVPAFWALLALLFVSRTNGRRAIRTIGGAFLLAVLVVVNVVINNPISQPRFWAGTVLLGIVFATTRARVNWRLVSATFVILLIVAFPYVDYFRYTHAGPITVTSMSSQLAANDDYDAYQQEETAVFYQGKTGYHPNYALGSLFFFVPRSIWASKPDDTGTILATYNGDSLTNRSAPLWIETYLWAGFPAVAIAFAAIGWFHTRTDRIFARGFTSGDRLGRILIPAVAFFQIIVLRGSLLQSMGPLTLLVVLPFLLSRRVPAPARLTTRRIPAQPAPSSLKG